MQIFLKINFFITRIKYWLRITDINISPRIAAGCDNVQCPESPPGPPLFPRLPPILPMAATGYCYLFTNPSFKNKSRLIFKIFSFSYAINIDNQCIFQSKHFYFFNLICISNETCGWLILLNSLYIYIYIYFIFLNIYIGCFSSTGTNWNTRVTILYSTPFLDSLFYVKTQFLFAVKHNSSSTNEVVKEF